MKRKFLAVLAILAGSAIALANPSYAAPQHTVKPVTSAPLPQNTDPLVYVQRYRGPQDEILRTLSLFGDDRAMLTTRFLNNSVALVQTGTWQREAKANRFTVLLTRENGKPMTRAAISFVGTPKRGGGAISASGKNVRNYGNFGLTMVPRADDKLVYHVNKGTLRLEGVGIQPTEIPNVKGVVRTHDGDLIYWATGGVGGYQNEGCTLYRFTTLIGKPRKLAAFPYRITKVSEVHATSGRPALIVSLTDGKFDVPRVVLIDPIREVQVKTWEQARLMSSGDGGFVLSRPGQTETFALDTIL